jgi:hypothetical protein
MLRVHPESVDRAWWRSLATIRVRPPPGSVSAHGGTPVVEANAGARSPGRPLEGEAAPDGRPVGRVLDIVSVLCLGPPRRRGSTGRSFKVALPTLVRERWGGRSSQPCSGSWTPTRSCFAAFLPHRRHNTGGPLSGRTELLRARHWSTLRCGSLALLAVCEPPPALERLPGPMQGFGARVHHAAPRCRILANVFTDDGPSAPGPSACGGAGGGIRGSAWRSAPAGRRLPPGAPSGVGRLFLVNVARSVMRGPSSRPS